MESIVKEAGGNMSLGLEDWDMEKINIKAEGKTILQLLSLYKEQERLLVDKDVEYTNALLVEDENAQCRITKELEHLNKEKCVIALILADMMVKGI